MASSAFHALPQLLDGDNLALMIEEGFIGAKPGPDGLTLYNYTPRAQYSRTWNRETMLCRGLVVRDDGTLQARPFPKFFNVGEHDGEFLPLLPVEPFEVYEKLDGSLIIASARPDGGVLLTTRGSFTSEQAVEAEAIWGARYADVTVPEGETWCLEFIAPWNRIVVDYGDLNDLVLLARLDNATGLDLPLPEWPGRVVERYDALADFDAITERCAALGPDEEGYVVRFESGIRAKVKGNEYMRLHKLLTGVSARTIWERLAANEPLDDLIELVPDEFHTWVSNTKESLTAAYAEIEAATLARHAEIAGLATRKDQALAVADFEHRGCIFKHLDGKPFDDLIWKALKPAAERPFKTDDDA